MEVAMRKLSIKKAGAVCLALLTAAAALAGCGAGEAGTAKDSKTKVVLNEVAHSIFMRPCMWPLRRGISKRQDWNLRW